MALLTALSVSQISDLENEAHSFQDHAIELHNITDQMFELINSTNSQWQGAAHDAFASKFNGLQDEMEHLYMMTVDYCEDLRQSAENYRFAEEENQEIAGQLESEIELLDF